MSARLEFPLKLNKKQIFHLVAIGIFLALLFFVKRGQRHRTGGPMKSPAHLKTLWFVSIVLAVALLSQPRPAEGDNPWALLADFHSLGAGRINDSAVVVVFSDVKEQLTALVVFPALCSGENCDFSDPKAFLVVDSEGSMVTLYVERGHEAMCHPIFAAFLEGFAVA
jgi:hypothetical protein